MKKLIISLLFLTAITGQVRAQSADDSNTGMFNHLSMGLSVGTDGLGIGVAAPIGCHFAVRAEYNFLPFTLKYKSDVKLGSDPAYLEDVDRVDIEGKLKMNSFALLFDYYPFKKSSFRITAGAYIATKNIIEIRNKSAFLDPAYYGTAGLQLGNAASVSDIYTVVSDNEGNIKADVKVNAFRPYIGIGFGRSVPRKRIGVQFDLGVQFWGKPELMTNLMYFDGDKGDFVQTYEAVNKERITREDGDYKDIRDGIKTAHKIRVYPVISVRLNGRIF